MIRSTMDKLALRAGVCLVCLSLVSSACRPRATDMPVSISEFPPHARDHWRYLWIDKFGEDGARVRELLRSRPLRRGEIEVLLADTEDYDAWDIVRLNLQHYDVYPAILSLKGRLPLNTLPNLMPDNPTQARWLERAALSCAAMQPMVAMDVCSLQGGEEYLRILRTLAAKGTDVTVYTIYLNAGFDVSNVDADLGLSKAIISRAASPPLNRWVSGCGRVLGSELLKSANEQNLVPFLNDLSETRNRSLILKATSVADYVSSVRRLKKALDDGQKGKGSQSVK